MRVSTWLSKIVFIWNSFESSFWLKWVQNHVRDRFQDRFHLIWRWAPPYEMAVLFDWNLNRLFFNLLLCTGFDLERTDSSLCLTFTADQSMIERLSKVMSVGFVCDTFSQDPFPIEKKFVVQPRFCHWLLKCSVFVLCCPTSLSLANNFAVKTFDCLLE